MTSIQPVRRSMEVVESQRSDSWKWKRVASLALVGALAPLVGCAFLGGAAAGAAGTSAAYEYQQKQALDELDRELERGKISSDEYRRRKKELQDRSIVY